MQDSKQKGELIKEVYARFGLAYYHSECLYREICIINVMLSYRDKNVITRARTEEKMSNSFSETIGQLSSKVKDLLPEEFHHQLDEAVEKRNFLAHHFWYDRAHLMSSSSGLLKMLDELDEYSSLFHNLDERLTGFFRSKWEQLGITKENFQKAFNDVIAGKSPDILLQKRKLKKQERLIKVWEFKLDDGTAPMIFETEDGELWQLCDVGLGWTYFKEIGPEWKEIYKIKAHLPANINPRPEINIPWNYEFNLKNNVVLWVKPGKRESTFEWGLRKKTKQNSSD